MINCRLLLMRFFKLVEYTSLFVNKKYHASALLIHEDIGFFAFKYNVRKYVGRRVFHVINL